eukprot:GHVT01005432.1.p1 GENE.GHVT01005432.1~~GHVT01005432.1.p1  ORF type:complete len:208 (-),score=18.54 GHVT01005432.1:448-1071(-)
MCGLFSYNGSSVVAMSGDGCVAIASDKRLGINRFSTISSNFPKVYRLNERTLAGFSGLATDMQTLAAELRFRVHLYELREERSMKPKVVSNLIGSLLYGRRWAPWFVSPVVAGLDEEGVPFLSAFDFIGAACTANDFVCAGTASEQLYGLCESLYKPNMKPDELSETLSQCLLAALDRDCVAGWGAVIHLISKDGTVTTKHLKGRMD